MLENQNLMILENPIVIYSLFIAPVVTGLGGALIGAYVTFRFERYKRRKGWYAVYLQPVEKLVDKILEMSSKALLNLSTKLLPDLTKPIFDLLVELLVATPYMYKTGDKRIFKLVGEFYFDTFAALEAIDKFLYNIKAISSDLFNEREKFFNDFKLALEPKIYKYYFKRVKKFSKIMQCTYKKYKNEKIVFSKIINLNMAKTLKIYKRIIRLKV